MTINDPVVDLIEEIRSGTLKVEAFTQSNRKQSGLDRVLDLTEARLASFKPMTVAERFEGFKRIGYRPGGLFVPHDTRLAEEGRAGLRKIAEIQDKYLREEAYYQHQERTSSWQRDGHPGKWSHQMAVATSEARFRIVAWGRRGGKTFHAAREALAVALVRPRSWIWCAGKTADATDRAFSMIWDLTKELGIWERCTTKRNQKHEKLLVLPNGSRIEGMSLDGEIGAAGTAIDYCILDEAEYTTLEDWQEKLEPVLTDKEGQAVLISSTQIDESWFWEFVEATRLEASMGEESEWEAFTGATWDNFFQFSQGRQSKTLASAARRMDPERFMAIYGGVPSSGRGRIFPAFIESVHVNEKAEYKPGHEVILVVDPSAGRNQYAVSAWHDDEEVCGLFDEYYETGKLAEEVIREIQRRPWFPDVTEVYIDPGWASEVTRWQQQGFNAYPVVNEDENGMPTNKKPEIKDTIPFVNLLLRDPTRFARLEDEVMGTVLQEWQWQEKSVPAMMPGQFETIYTNERGAPLTVNEKKLLAIEVVERLSPGNLTPEQMEVLRECARLFINPRCEHTITEMKHYRWKKIRLADAEQKEEPRKINNHLVDTIRYFAWTKKRHFFGPDFAPGGGMMDSQRDPYGSREYQGTNWVEQLRLAAKRR